MLSVSRVMVQATVAACSVSGTSMKILVDEKFFNSVQETSNGSSTLYTTLMSLMTSSLAYSTIRVT